MKEALIDWFYTGSSIQFNKKYQKCSFMCKNINSKRRHDSYIITFNEKYQWQLLHICSKTFWNMIVLYSNFINHKNFHGKTDQNVNIYILNFDLLHKNKHDQNHSFLSHKFKHTWKKRGTKKLRLHLRLETSLLIHEYSCQFFGEKIRTSVKWKIKYNFKFFFSSRHNITGTLWQ